MNPPPYQSDSFFDRVNLWLRTSTMIKLAIVGILVLVLLIPTFMLEGLIRERESTRAMAIREVSEKWGATQTVSGPILSVPYLMHTKGADGKAETSIAYAHVLPDNLTITGTIQPEKRNRGLFQVMLYNTRLTIRGSLPRPSAERLGIAPADMQWDKAFVSLGVTDMKGIKDQINLRVDGKALTVEPGIPTTDILASGVSARTPLGDSITFDCALNINGSSDLYFLPFGKQTIVSLTSPWTTPSFVGASLPDRRTLNAKGFTANWKVLQYNRNYPQQGTGAFLNRPISNSPDSHESVAASSAFGVKLLLPVDEYQKTMRSAKYAVMFIIITFTAFFFVEILNKQRIHPIQYLLVGFAVCLFYLLLLAISEHVAFNVAYLISAAVTLAMISFYVRHVFKNGRLTILFSSVLALLYGFFFSLLQLEDYSLLLGSLGLALILGIIMYLTRNVNWYRAYETT
ncbi:cell envelope integrity protein CreD [Fibrella sp. HMF5335]|uniref:Cell envelope integrity protein CreD n=1 Tax=Fibrella rubiginis TaxID=2817060 RepID=A0A939GDE4_9BACT|nr:cell envelope integrity protein CreD [Fibrella rubiginis]MBO0937047.1 cell envelope integrity protein CreD [Fibrella rubiginis]